MKKRLLFTLLMPCFPFLTTSCSSSTNTTPSDGGYSNNSVHQTPNVKIENFSFKPQILIIKVGTTVKWFNNDTTTHNIRSTDFSSPDIWTGGNFQFKFDNPGTYEYNCGIHPNMTGKIIVE